MHSTYSLPLMADKAIQLGGKGSKDRQQNVSQRHLLYQMFGAYMKTKLHISYISIEGLGPVHARSLASISVSVILHGPS